MAQWLVTQNDHQFSVEGLSALKDLARAGKLSAGDMIQPPGASDWIYAAEVEDLRDLLPDASGDGDDDLDAYLARRNPLAKILPMVAAVVLLAIIVVGGGISFVLYQQLPTGEEEMIGEGGLSYSQMLTTDATELLANPEAGAKSLRSLKKDTVLDLLSKRGDYYKARTEGGKTGWVAVAHTIPMYQLGGDKVRDKYDPLYNPDQYVTVANASWQQLPDQRKDRITVFQFQLRNTSDYLMTDLVLLATIKDAKGHEVEKVEIPIEGMIPPGGRTMVGTLKPEDRKSDEATRLLTNFTLDKLSLEDEDVMLRFSDGVEVEMQSEAFANAQIDILELRAVPDDEARAFQKRIERLAAERDKARGDKAKKGGKKGKRRKR